MQVSVIDIRSFFGGARIIKKEPTILDKFKAGTLDLKKCTGQDLRDIYSLLRGGEVGRKTSPGLSTKKMLIVWCLEKAEVAHLYPGV